MKKFSAAVVAMACVALALLVPVSPASAYPDPVCDVQVSSTEVRSGKPFTVTVTSDVAADLVATYRGTTRSKSNTTELVAKFVAPRTSKNLTTVVTTSCDGQPGASAEVLVLGSASSGDDDNDNGNGNGLAGLLPNTGGTSFWLLLVGALLLLSGGTLVARRRA